MAVVETRPPRPSRRARERERYQPSVRVWRLLAGSGIVLLVLVTVHMVANHFVVESVGGLRTYEQVLDYIGHPLIFTIECFFLLVVTVHAMLGLRSVLLDMRLGTRGRRRVDAGLWLLGIATVAYGFYLVGTLASRA
jgi:succinate dehydrogenase / fumarate reductase, membrane anchor subunit